MIPASTVYILAPHAPVRLSLQRLLGAAGLAVHSSATADDLLAGQSTGEPGCILWNQDAADPEWRPVAERLRQAGAWPILILAAQPSVEDAVAAMRWGIFDYAPQPVEPERLVQRVRAALVQDAANRSRAAQVHAAREQLARLTERERQLLTCLVQGCSHKEAAAQLGISPRTVEHHRASITVKLRAGSVAELVRLSLLAGETDPDALVPAPAATAAAMAEDAALQLSA